MWNSQFSSPKVKLWASLELLGLIQGSILRYLNQQIYFSPLETKKSKNKLFQFQVRKWVFGKRSGKLGASLKGFPRSVLPSCSVVRLAIVPVSPRVCKCPQVSTSKCLRPVVRPGERLPDQPLGCPSSNWCCWESRLWENPHWFYDLSKDSSTNSKSPPSGQHSSLR